MPKFKPEFAVLPVDSLTPFVRNPRRHPPEAIEAVKRSVEHFGWTNPLIVRKTDRLILAGHARLEVAQARGMKEVPCVLVDMNDEDAKAYVIADNQTVLLSQWDEEALRGSDEYCKARTDSSTGFSVR